MTEQELADLVAFGTERSDVEFKGAGRADDRPFFAKIVRAVLAFSNRRDGGVVLVGIAEKPGSPASLIGLSADEAASWIPDLVRDRLAVFADPSVDVTVERVSVGGKDVVAITVREFADVPVICRKDGEGLREGAIYVRSRRKPESVELPRQAEMRDLIELATEKRLRGFLATASAAGLGPWAVATSTVTVSDEARFREQATGVDSAIAQKARSQGYWTVEISPITFSARRVPKITDLAPIVREAAVSYRGWPYPSVLAGEEPKIGRDSISFEIDSRIHVESWRMFQSGLFSQVMGFWEDWYVQDTFFRSTGERVPEQGKTLGIDLTIGTLTELFEFASRLALSAAGGETMVIRLGAHGLAGRALEWPRTVIGFSVPKVAEISDFVFEPVVVERAALAADPDSLAAQAARELFQRFGWDASLERLNELQRRIRQR